MNQEFPIEGIAWSTGLGQPAGIYWLAGRCAIVGHGSPAEARLLGAGAVLIATLRFGPPSYETSHRGRTIQRVRPTAVLRGAGSPNGN